MMHSWLGGGGWSLQTMITFQYETMAMVVLIDEEGGDDAGWLGLAR